MAIGNHNDLTHIVRTSDQWKNTYDKYELIPTGVLCVELVSSDVTKIKIGDGHNIFSKLPYIGDLDLSKYYTKLETDTRIKEILTQEKVVRIKGLIGSKSDLPADARCGDIYFVRQLSSSDNKYIEYIYSPDNTWEPLGGIPVDIDLSEYAKTAYVDDKIEQVNERIDDIEQHGTHTHPNKEILDQITEPYTTADKETLASLHNYDDTEIREMISQSSHTHANKDILDATSAAFTKEDKSKLDQLNPYDDSILKEKITALERLAHEHSNKRILDRTTASFTTEYERKMCWIRIYTGCTGMEEGIAGLVPAAQAGEEDYVLSGSGEWVPQTGGGGTYTLPIATASTLGGIKVGNGLEIDANGVLSTTGGGGSGDSIAEGDGITITTDPQTGVKTISVNTGDNLEVDPNTGELNVTGVDYEAGQGIRIGADYTLIEYIKNSGNYDQIIITDIIPVFSDKIELDIKFGAATVETVSDDKFFGCYNNSSTVYSYYGSLYLSSNSYVNIGIYNHFKYESGNTGDNFFTYPDGISYDGTSSVRHTLTVQGSTANWNNSTRNFSSYYNQSFSDPQIGIAIFGMNKVSGDTDYFSQCNLTVYGVKLYDSNNTLLHDLRPAERGTDGEAGLYDLVTHKFYGNAGNGSFIKGPVVTAPDRIINAKIGDGLQFDSNNAIEVVTGNGLQINQDGELEIDPSIIPDVPEYSSGEAITIRDVSQILPAGYVEVDYIEGIGNYTVINYIPNRKTKIVGTALQTQTSYDPVLFGARTGSNGQQFVFWFNRYDSTQAKVGFVYGTNTWSTSTDCNNGRLIPYVIGEQFTFLLSLDDEFNINDTFVHNITENGAPASNLKLGIFALVSTSSDEIESSDQIFKGRIYEFKIYEDDELVVNLIPAVSTSTNQSGFYDVINDIFYTSKTATPFGYDPSTIHSTGKVIDVNYGNGLTVNQDNELEVNIGDGLSVNANNEVELSKATANALGGIKVGSGFVYTSDGLLNATPAAPPFDVGDGLELIYDDIDALPNGYGHVDYVCSNPENNSINANGRARTLIDYVPTNTTKLAIKMQRDSEHSDLCFIGSRIASRDHEFCFWNEYDSVTELAFSYGNTNYSNAYVTYSSYITGQIIEVECVVGDTSNTLSVNGTVVKTYTKDGDASPYKLGIFQLYLNESWGHQIANGKIYYIKLYEGNTLAVNLIPAVRLVDEVVGFYDNVNDKFYTSNTEYPFTTDMSTIVIDGAPRTLNAKYNNGLMLNQNNELEVNIGTGLEFDQTTGAINVTGGGDSGNYIEGEAIEFEESASRLPTGYTELENISNISASYIDTGYIPNTDTQLSIIANIHRGTTSWQTLFGARDAVNPGGAEYAFFVRLNDNYNFYPRITGDQYTYMPNQTYDEKIRININNTTATVTRQDGSSYSYTQTGSLSNLSTTLAIFALHNQTGYVDNGIIDLYSFKIYENNTIVKDFVPCKRNSDDAIGLIDIINNVFYTNLGTGTFTAGRILTNTSINVKYGDGLSVNQDNELEINTGNGLQINQDGEVEIDPSIIPDSYDAGNGIEITEVTHEDEFRVQNQEYFFTDHGLTCIITGNYGPRTFTKINDGDIVAAVIGTTGGWYMPLFVGLTEDSVKYSNSYDSNILGPTGSFTYHDKTWYYTADYALAAGDGVDHAGHLQSMTDTIYAETAEGKIQAAKDLIDLAVLLPDVSTPTINAKIGAGLSFDANGAIQADAQPLSPATDSTLGGVIVGDNLSIDSNGVLTANVINYSSGHAIEITGDLSIDKFRWEITKNAGDSMVAFRYFEYSDSSHIAFTVQAGTIEWSDGSTVSYPSGYDETFAGMMENRTKCTVTGWTGDKTLIMTFRLAQSIMLSDIAYFRWQTDDYMSGRQPQEFNIYAHDSINDEWILLKSVTDHALVPSSSNTWSTYIDIEPPEIESGSINVKYGNGLTLNQNNELEVATASASTLGGIKVGDGLSIAADGTLSATGGGSGGGNYSAGEAIEIDTSLFNVDAIRWDISDIKDPIQSFSANGPWAQVRYIQFRDNSNNAILIDSGSGVWSDDTAVSYYQDLTLANMIANTQKMCASWRSPDLTMKLTFLLDSPVNVSSVAKFRILLGDDEPHRDPKAWSIYVRNATTQEWHLVHTTADAQLPATRNVWTDDFLLENPNRSIINVKYGNGLTVNASNELEVDLPVASDSTLGGVIVGEGINVDEHGEISLSAGEGLDIDFESSLPSEYTLVKGISSVGHNDSPYINTGYLIKPTSRIIVQGVLYKTTSGWTFPIGVRHNNYSNPVMFCTHHDSNGDSIELWLSNDTLIASATDREKCYNDPVTIIISSDGLSIENETTGEVVTLTTSDTLPIATLPLYVFATNDNNTLSFSGPMDLYRMQIFEGATKVLDYLPCKRNSDNKYGVYDIVANEYKASSNASLFELVTGTPSGDDLVQQIKLLPATENTIGGVKPGDGILVDNDGTISVDPTIIPEITEYEAGTAISIKNVEHGGVTFDVWNSGTGWRNWAYTSGTGDGGISWNPEVHSPVADSWKIPAGAIQVRVKVLSTSDVLLHPTMHWLTGKGTGRFGYSCPTGVMPYDYWIEVNSNATYMNLGIRKSEGSNIALSPSEIKSVELTFQTVSEIEVDVWDGGTGWLNGDYTSSNSDSFVTSWYYTYHYNYQQYIEVPAGATHVMVRGISNENDSHFEGGGINAFDSNHHHVHWWDCAWEWHEISSDTVYVQPNVKWNNDNTRTISGSDVKSVTLVWKLPALEINQAINVKYGNGLTVNQNNELEVNIGTGLEFDQTTGAINVTGGGSGDTVAEGAGIEITTDQQTGNKVIAVNPGSGLQVNQTTNELEPKLGDGLELDEYNAITVDPFYPNTLILNCVLDDEPSSDLILHFTLDPDE